MLVKLTPGSSTDVTIRTAVILKLKFWKKNNNRLVLLRLTEHVFQFGNSKLLLFEPFTDGFETLSVNLVSLHIKMTSFLSAIYTKLRD
jgi:hypothetical protein